MTPLSTVDGSIYSPLIVFPAFSSVRLNILVMSTFFSMSDRFSFLEIRTDTTSVCLTFFGIFKMFPLSNNRSEKPELFLHQF